MCYIDASKKIHFIMGVREREKFSKGLRNEYSSPPSPSRFEDLVLREDNGIPTADFLACCRAVVPFFGGLIRYHSLSAVHNACQVHCLRFGAWEQTSLGHF